MILKDFDGHPVAQVSLSSNEVMHLAMASKAPRKIAPSSPEKSLPSSSSGSTPSHVHGDLTSKLVNSSGSKAGAFCHVVAALILFGGLVGALFSGNVIMSFGVAASSAPIFAIGSIANSTKRSAKILKWMAEQENRRRAATPDT